MNLLTWAQIKSSELPYRMNMCPDDPRFLEKVNRALEWLFLCGSWMGTIRPVWLCVNSSCVVAPPWSANIESIQPCNYAGRIENNWYRTMPGFSPLRWERGDLWFEYFDQIPTTESLCRPRIIRAYPSQTTDYGKTVTFLGYDVNKQLVRIKRGGVWQDGETLTLMPPFVETQTEFTSIYSVLKDETDGPVRVFAHKIDDDSELTPIGDYQYWETVPSYQRYRVHNQKQLNCRSCCQGNIVEAQIKLCHIPIRKDADILPIQNRVGLELAVMGVKCLDDGDMAEGDRLLYGDTMNKRVGAVPLLNQEIRTQTGDRFSAFVRVGGPCGLPAVMRGMW